jgi:5-methylcytosine-specific restriction endonuclease McrA
MEEDLFKSEAWQKASREQRINFISKIKATERIERERIKKQIKKPIDVSKASVAKKRKQTKKLKRIPKATVSKNRVTSDKSTLIKVDGIDVTTNDFLSTYQWRRTRMVALKKYGARCQCCGAGPATGAVIHVDHIKPRKLFPHLALDVNNLQVLCHECNHGKGNWDMTDWRNQIEHSQPVI